MLGGGRAEGPDTVPGAVAEVAATATEAAEVAVAVAVAESVEVAAAFVR